MTEMIILAKTPIASYGIECSTVEMVNEGALLQIEKEARRFSRITERLSGEEIPGRVQTLLGSFGKCSFEILCAHVDCIWGVHVDGVIWAACSNDSGSDVIPLIIANKEKLGLSQELTMEDVYDAMRNADVAVRKNKYGKKCCLIKAEKLGHRSSVFGMVLLIEEEYYK